MNITITINESIIQETINEIHKKNIKEIDIKHMPFQDFNLIVKHKMNYNDALNKIDKELKGAINPFNRMHYASRLVKQFSSFEESIRFKLNKDNLFISSEDYEIDIPNNGVIEFGDNKSLPCEVNLISDMLIDEIKNRNKFDQHKFLMKVCLDALVLLECVIIIFNRKVEYNIVENETVKVSNIKNKKSKSKSNNKTYIKHKTITINKYSNDNITNRNYERHTESWIQRGHWRTYKSGKKVWIKECVKNAKNSDSNDISKIYEII